jgi:anti-sigma regulatory factor (Ser/Thr protein kinase)
VRNMFLVAPTSRVSCLNDPDQAWTHVAVRGQWDGEVRSQVAQALRACVAETPRAIIADTVDAASLLLGPFLGWNHRHVTLRLPPQQTSVVVARSVASEACVDFHLAHLIHPARLIVSELAGNAVEHATTGFELQVSVRGPLLHLSVRDQDPRLPRLIEAGPGPAQERLLTRGCGLRVVAEAATGWGALPCPGGKVVWATLPVDGRPTP